MNTFYDIGVKQPIKTFPPNPWKTRYLLNTKNPPYKTIYVDLQNLAHVLKEAGVPPSATNPDGSPFYSTSSIFDDATATGVSESYRIAEYLDKVYPDTLKAFPPGSEALQAAFYHQWFNTIPAVFGRLITPQAVSILAPGGAAFFRRGREEIFGKPFDQLALVGEEREKAWREIKETYEWLGEWYSKTPGPYFMGEVPSFADTIVAGVIQAAKILLGEDSKEWKDFSAWNGGRWVKLNRDLEKYASTEH